MARASGSGSAAAGSGQLGGARRFVARPRGAILRAQARGGMAEWLKAHAWKACIRETVSWVRIPLPPPALRSLSFAAVQKCRIFLRFFLLRVCAHPPPFAMIHKLTQEILWDWADDSVGRKSAEKPPPNPQIVGGIGGTRAKQIDRAQGRDGDRPRSLC